MSKHDDYLDPQPFMDLEESAAIGRAMEDCMREILAQFAGGDTLASLQRAAYKYTDAGISVGFELHDGSFLWNGDARARDPAMVGMVAKIGISSIVEGSDAEVPLVWLDLLEFASPDGDHGEDFAAKAAERYGQICDQVNDEACALWHEANSENDAEDDA